MLEYLSKKGYSRTESMLRRESANLDPQGQPIPSRIEDTGGRMYFTAYDLALTWIANTLDIYAPEFRRLRWPLFLYSYFRLITEFYPSLSREFFVKYRGPFETEHADDLRAVTALTTPEHLQENCIAQLYLKHKYRLTLSNMTFWVLIQFLETNEHAGGRQLTSLLQDHLDIRMVDRNASAGGSARSLQRLLESRQNGTTDDDVPAEDEGIPGHHPGSANLERNAPSVLNKLALGAMPMEADLMEDVKADLAQADLAAPPLNGTTTTTLIEQFEHNIKTEPSDDIPASIPLPPSSARDVSMEVQKVHENRDRFRIEGRTGGVGPGVSVTMFTFHNTFDSVNCVEFSGDNSLVAIGTSESYIRIWSLDNTPLVSPLDDPSLQPSSSRRLIGHSGPVYALAFSPSIAVPADPSASHPTYLLSGSADTTIRLWSLSTYTNLVVYRAHSAPIWSLAFSPHGHYFASGSSDRSARLWSTPQICPLRLFIGHESDVETLAWHPNGAYLFTGGGEADRTVRMWRVSDGNAVRLFTGHTGNVTALACAGNGKVVASADDRGEILLWDLPSGRLLKRMRGHTRGGIWSLGWSVESSVLVSGGADGTVRVWDAVGAGAGGGGVGGGADGGAETAAATTLKKKKDVVVSADQISAFATKRTPVYKVGFTQMNLVVAGGAYLP